MAIDINELVEELEVHAPAAVEVPRNPTDNTVRTSTIQRWAEDGAAQINQKRGVTTRKEEPIVTEAGVQEYALPPDYRQKGRLRRGLEAPMSSRSTLGIPDQGANIFGFGGGLPSGQEISASLDVIGRQRTGRMRREDTIELIGGQLRLLFPVEEGETIIFEYEAIDRDLANVPEDYFTLLLTWVRVKNLDWFFEKRGVNLATRGDGFIDQGMVALRQIRNELERQWQTGLEAIAPAGEA